MDTQLTSLFRTLVVMVKGSYMGGACRILLCFRRLSIGVGGGFPQSRPSLHITGVVFRRASALFPWLRIVHYRIHKEAKFQSFERATHKFMTVMAQMHRTRFRDTTANRQQRIALVYVAKQRARSF